MHHFSYDYVLYTTIFFGRRLSMRACVSAARIQLGICDVIICRPIRSRPHNICYGLICDDTWHSCVHLFSRHAIQFLIMHANRYSPTYFWIAATCTSTMFILEISQKISHLIKHNCKLILNKNILRINYPDSLRWNWTSSESICYELL